MKKLLLFFAFITLFINAHSQNVIQGEYFVDADPGFGNATGFAISLPDSDITQAINIPYSAFPGPGYHYVYMRTQDANGSWSLTAKRIVEVDDNPYLNNVIQVEYFFDTDAGFGNNSSIALTPSTDSTWIFNIPFNQLPLVANDTLFVRVLDNPDGDWSITTYLDSLNITLTGLQEYTNGSFDIFPNPCNGKFALRVFDSGSKANKISVFNISGEKVYEMNYPMPGYHQINIDLTALNKGIYLVQITTDENVFYQKMIFE